MPIELYSVVPEPNQTKDDVTVALNRRTQEAAARVMRDPAFNGKTVVMVWEHDHIANAKLEKEYPNEAVTLRQLLHLEAMKDAAATWPGENYDYFWIVDYADGRTTPKSFATIRQDFGSAAPTVPANGWGTPNGLTAASGCVKVGG